MNQQQFEKGFREWCKYTLLPNSHKPIFSTSYLAKNFFETTFYKMKKKIKVLEAYNYVQKDYEGGIDEEGNPHCYHGWTLTKKALDTKIGREEQAKVEEYIEKELLQH